MRRLERWFDSAVHGVEDAARSVHPRFDDMRSMLMIAASIGLGVFLLGWHVNSLRLVVSSANMVWVPLVAFGITWTAPAHGSWRMGAGMVLGVAAAITGFYTALVLLPVSPIGIAIGMAIVIALVVLVSEIFGSYFSLAGAAVGFGIGTAGSVTLPINPTTSGSDMASLVITALLAVVIGVVGGVVLRAIVDAVQRAPESVSTRAHKNGRVLRLPRPWHSAAERHAASGAAR